MFKYRSSRWKWSKSSETTLEQSVKEKSLYAHREVEGYLNIGIGARRGPGALRPLWSNPLKEHIDILIEKWRGVQM